jgi:hypothetical protein
MSVRYLPDVVTHTFHPEAVFLSNICDLNCDEAQRILSQFRINGARLKSNYLDRRLETESWLIEERDRILGQTRRKRPIYFFLGNFADWVDASRPNSLVMPLKVFPPEILTFTYPDSMAALANKSDAQWADRKPYHGKVFSLSEIKQVVREFGCPHNSKQNPAAFGERFIEMQVWDERPITEFCAKQRS